MEEKLEPLALVATVLEREGSAIIAAWTAAEEPRQILARLKIEPAAFGADFGSAILQYFIDVVRGQEKVGDCPALRRFIDFLADRRISVGDLFILCMGLRRAVGDAVFTHCHAHDSAAALRATSDALHALFNANLRGVLDLYYERLDEMDHRLHELELLGESKDRMLALQERQAVLGEMIGAISHQWKQPINAILLEIQGLRDAYDYHELDRATLDGSIARIHRQAEFLGETIEVFRRFLKPQQQVGPFQLQQAVEEVIHLVGRQYCNHGINLDIENGRPLQVIGLRNEFEQVLINLLSNARDAILRQPGRRGQITLQIGQADGFAVLRVHDNGGGIADGFESRLFQPYQTTHQEGTGIGLYIAQLLMEKMGGSICACNRDGGAEFTLRLPLTPE